MKVKWQITTQLLHSACYSLEKLCTFPHSSTWKRSGKRGTRMEWSELLSVGGRGFRNSFGSWGQQRNKHCMFVYIHALCEVLRCFSSMSFRKLVFQKWRRTIWNCPRNFTCIISHSHNMHTPWGRRSNRKYMCFYMYLVVMYLYILNTQKQMSVLGHLFKCPW